MSTQMQKVLRLAQRTVADNDELRKRLHRADLPKIGDVQDPKLSLARRLAHVLGWSLETFAEYVLGPEAEANGQGDERALYLFGLRKPVHWRAGWRHVEHVDGLPTVFDCADCGRRRAIAGFAGTQPTLDGVALMIDARTGLVAAPLRLAVFCDRCFLARLERVQEEGAMGLLSSNNGHGAFAPAAIHSGSDGMAV